MVESWVNLRDGIPILNDSCKVVKISFCLVLLRLLCTSASETRIKKASSETWSIQLDFNQRNRNLLSVSLWFVSLLISFYATNCSDTMSEET